VVGRLPPPLGTELRGLAVEAGCEGLTLGLGGPLLTGPLVVGSVDGGGLVAGGLVVGGLVTRGLVARNVAGSRRVVNGMAEDV